MDRMLKTYDERRRLLQLDRQALVEQQISALNALLKKILPLNQFYADRIPQDLLPLASMEALAQLPFTTKQELVDNPDPDQSSQGLAANLTYPVHDYVRFHRTSGTSGRPLVVLDTAEDWLWWLDTWQFVLDAAQMTSNDRVLMAFSFGPFIGFWSAHDASVARGALVIPGGGLSSLARLELMQSSRATIFFSTPSYALHLADVAQAHNIDVASSRIDRIVVAGEPGGSVSAIRQRIESQWQAKLIDHSGASEVGPWGFADPAGQGLFVNESQFIAEFRALDAPRPADEGELAELVLTSLGRAGCPVIRYRTGDLVRPIWNYDSPDGCRFVLLEGGVLGRIDDMMVIRGVNIYPSSIEQIIRSFPDVVEYRMTAFKQGQMDSLKIEIETPLGAPQRIADELNVQIGLKIDVQQVDDGTLPRFEAKGKRFIDQR
jgi:phenylacetate-CoA ligase